MRGRGTAARLVLMLIASLSAGPAMAGVYAATADTLKDRAALVATMHEHEAKELPIEALGVYVQGLTAWDAGRTDDAMASFTLAAELDPSFPEPHLALARLLVFRDPAQAAAALAAAFRASTSSFLEQQRLAANIVLSTFVCLIAGFLVLVAYAAVQHLSRLHHATTEILAPWFPGRHAAMCASLLFFVPILWRIGGLPLAFLAAGLLWPWMRPGQRRWIGGLGVGVVTAPVALWAISPYLLAPLDPASVPFLLARSNVAVGSPEIVASLETARGEHPKHAELCFALARLEKRAGHYAKARQLYEEAQELGSSPAVVQNNLAVISFLEGNYDTALELFQRSIANEPDRVAAHFNLSQTYAKKLYFEKADQELKLANRLSIDDVRSALRAAGGEARRTLIDEGVPHKAIWGATTSAPRRMPGLPAAMDVWFRGSLWLLPFLSIACFLVTLRLGRRLHRHLPAMACANCGRPICRRCLKRIRQAAYCGPCGEILLRIQSASYSKLVLDTQIRRKRRWVALLLRVTAWIFPGLYASRRGRDTLAAILALVSTICLIAILESRLPVRRLVWLEGLRMPWWPELPALALGLALAISAFTVLKLKPAPVRAGLSSTDPELGRERAA